MVICRVSSYVELIETFQNIEKCLKSFGIENYTINNDFSVDIDGDVNLRGELTGIGVIPVNFGKVTGTFICGFNNLKSLKGCPYYVGGSFLVGYNELESLEHGPQVVMGNYSCHDNLLTSLVGVPKIIGGDFDCSHNRLTSLEGGPEIVNGEFAVHTNKLQTLKNFPKVLKNVYIGHNQLTSFEHIQKVIDGNFYFDADLLLTSPDGYFPKVSGQVYGRTSNDEHMIIFPHPLNCKSIGT